MVKNYISCFVDLISGRHKDTQLFSKISQNLNLACATV